MPFFVNRYYEECDYLNVRRGHEDSPCAKAAPRVFDLLEAVVLCEKQDSSTDCKTKKQCYWYISTLSISLSSIGVWCRISSEYYCEADDLAIFFEIENFRYKVAKVNDQTML